MGPVKFAFVVTVAALPVTLPAIGFVTVKFALQTLNFKATGALA